MSFYPHPFYNIIFLKVNVKVIQLCLTLCDPMDYTVHGILQARILDGQPFPSPGDLPNPGIKPRSCALQVDSLAAEPQGKPKTTGVGSLSLLQQIFPTQELNWKIPSRRERLPTPVFWPGELHGLHSSWGCKESDIDCHFAREIKGAGGCGNFLKYSRKYTVVSLGAHSRLAPAPLMDTSTDAQGPYTAWYSEHSHRHSTCAGCLSTNPTNWEIVESVDMKPGDIGWAVFRSTSDIAIILTLIIKTQ